MRPDNWLLAVFTMGEGWHNNHHVYQSSVQQGFRWWEVDQTIYILKVLSWFGLVWDLKTPPVEVRRNEHRLSSRVMERAAAQLAVSFDPDSIVSAIAMALAKSSLSAKNESAESAGRAGAENLHRYRPHARKRADALFDHPRSATAP
jgi:stearoyl-CoA desaturase (delta-9 desaturase)